MIETIDELISRLQELRQQYGGDYKVAIEDADTRWHLRIENVDIGDEKDRILIEGSYNEVIDEKKYET